MSPFDAAVLLLAMLVVVFGFVGCLMLLLRAAKLDDRALRLAEAALAPKVERGAEVREIRNGRPHLRLVIGELGADVDRDVFPNGDAA